MAPRSGQKPEEARKGMVPSREAEEPVQGQQGAPARPEDPKRYPESLEPRTLRLLWGHRELEIQALRWNLRTHQDTRNSYILQEVAGYPTHRSWLSQEIVLQKQIQKLTRELQEQKELARLEKEHLETELLQSCQTLQQMEAELHAYRKSCLLQLARSSWVGRVLRSSTGSVEVVTAENLVDFSDSSEDDRFLTGGEGFRMEDVDWNSIAHRYPNLLSNMETKREEKYWRFQHPERLKGVEWGFLPGSLVGTNSGSSSSQQTECPEEQVVPEYPAGTPAWTSTEPENRRAEGPCVQAQADTEGRYPHHLKTPVEQQKKNVRVPRDVDPETLDLRPSPMPSCLRITSVSRREHCISILNESLEQKVDLTGHVLVQQIGDFPVCMYRFPSNTLLEPQHHITIWGEDVCSTRKERPRTRRQTVHFYSSQCCVTLLLNPKGEVLSSFRAPHCVSEVSRLYEDNTDLSIDSFPLTEAKTGQRLRQPRSRKGRRVRRQRPRIPEYLPRLCPSKPVDPQEVPARPESAHTQMPPQPLQVTPEFPLGLDGCQDRKEHKIKVGRKRVDRTCPMVALSVQNTAESKFGFRFLSYPPITAAPLACLRPFKPCQKPG